MNTRHTRAGLGSKKLVGLYKEQYFALNELSVMLTHSEYSPSQFSPP